MWNPFKRSGRQRAKLQSVTVNIPYAGSATFIPEESEVRAAWSLYVEISTRVPVQPIDPQYGSVREAPIEEAMLGYQEEQLTLVGAEV